MIASPPSTGSQQAHLVEHERRPRLGLRLQDGEPQALRGDRLAAQALALVAGVSILVETTTRDEGGDYKGGAKWNLSGIERSDDSKSKGSPLVEALKLLAPGVSQARTLVRAHQRPHAIALNSLHEEIRDPKCIKEVSSTLSVSNTSHGSYGSHG